MQKKFDSKLYPFKLLAISVALLQNKVITMLKNEIKPLPLASCKLYFPNSSGIESGKSVPTLAMKFPIRRIVDFVGVVLTICISKENLM